jgi:hypothetical protein
MTEKMRITIPEMSWPNPHYGNETEAEFSLGRRLCFGGHKNLSEEDVLYIASVLSAYKQLFSKTTKQRNFIFKEIKAALKKSQDGNQ